LKPWLAISPPIRVLMLVSSSICLFGGCKRSSPGPARQGELKAQIEQKLAGTRPGEELEVEPGIFMTMFRSQATAPLPDGWQVATSTQGGFSVEIPLPFNDLRMRSQTEDHVELMADIVGAKSPGLLSWMAACTTRADGKIGLPSGPRPTNSTGSMGTPPKAWRRTIVLDRRVCGLIVEAQGTDPLPSDNDIQRFLRSFKEVH
jgi:hypothetical protein